MLLHLPMWWMARSVHFRLAGMPMDRAMTLGMGLIIAGIVAAAYGLLPERRRAAGAAGEFIAPPEDTPLTLQHWWRCSRSPLSSIS